jgi:hypothetical protein
MVCVFVPEESVRLSTSSMLPKSADGRMMLVVSIEQCGWNKRIPSRIPEHVQVWANNILIQEAVNS